ncbi:MAG: hydrogenase maturation nickel metallochaperone HypA [Nitrospinae bacterium]|nr:hydrogenase maturation nickel metallochaperone HypA [Nitrospinota bacterium]
MHEMSIALSVVDIVADYARRNGAERVRRVTVEVGALSGVVPEALAFAYDEAAAGSLAEGSELTLVAIPSAARCRACGHAFAPDYHIFVCPACGSLETQLTAGEELAVTEMEVDDAEDH